MKRSRGMYKRKIARRNVPPHRLSRKQRLRVGAMRRRSAQRPAKVDYTLILRRNLKELSVIVSINNQANIHPALMGNLQKLQPKEIIVTQCGNEDSRDQGNFGGNVQFYPYPSVLGNGFGRAIGAGKATGNVILFLEGDKDVSTAELLPFVIACYGNADLALNNMYPFLSALEISSPVFLVKSFLNKSLNLPNLKYASLVDTPHAMKKSAAEKIGYENLAIPPKAMAIAAVKGLVLSLGGKVNRLVKGVQEETKKQVILGDHVEAFQYIQSAIGVRSFFGDHLRKRDVIKEVKGK